MRKLKLEVQISLDGYIADAEGNANWMLWNWGPDWNWDQKLKDYHIDLITSCDSILLSRKMAEEGFISHWQNVSQDPGNPQYPFAKHITDIKKVVFSWNLKESLWENATLVNADSAEQINEMKNSNGEDMIVFGGATFVSSLIKENLIDEYHLIVNPIALGAGLAIFQEGNQMSLYLEKAESYSGGIVVLKYLQMNR
jgi:dihydrofolate reductase